MGKGVLRAYPPNKRGESYCPHDCPGIRFDGLEAELAHEMVLHSEESKTCTLAVTIEWYRRQLLSSGDENQQQNFAQNVVLAALYAKAARLESKILLPALEKVPLASTLVWTDDKYEPLRPAVDAEDGNLGDIRRFIHPMGARQINYNLPAAGGNAQVTVYHAAKSGTGVVVSSCADTRSGPGADRAATLVAAAKLSTEKIRGFERVSVGYGGFSKSKTTGQFFVAFTDAFFPHSLLGGSDQWASLELVWKAAMG